ncbi:AmmeMemoRadiSam system protein A [Patescibacteria group bacterium]|nr:AmmeMemoRadiSam system protein A [Patescibacteria group bacterium]
MLNQQEQQIALKLARQTLENYFDSNKIIKGDYKNYPIFNKEQGVFVTLHKDEELRGCIGLIEPFKIPLAQTIQQMALSAAFNDTRFSLLTPDELNKVKIEISVLSAPQKSIADKIKLGKHGVIIKSGFNSGIFLPQVAIETRWTKNQFLSELCSQKAGLSPNCWKNPDVELWTFEAQIFSE